MVFAVCAAALAGTVLVSTLTGASSGSITVAVTLVLAVAVRVAIGSLHTLDLALLALAFVLSIHGATPRDLGMLMSPLLIGLGLKVRRTVRALLLVLSAVAVLTALGLASPQPRAAVVDQILFNAIGSIAIVIGVRVLMQAGHRADSAYRDLTSALVRDRVFTARREALLDYLRLLRDEIMGTLTLIREAAMAEGLAEQMRDACRRAARAARDAVEAPGSRSATGQEISLTGLADIVAHLSPPGVTVRSRAASAGSLPDELVWAVLLQARQAMTALGGTEFMLDLEVSREGLVLSGSGQVIRIGTGDPRTASSLRATYDATVEGLSSTGLVLLGLLAPLSQLPLALRYTAISEHPGWSLLLLAAYAALTALVLRTLHSGPPRPLEIVGLLGCRVAAERVRDLVGRTGFPGRPPVLADRPGRSAVGTGHRRGPRPLGADSAGAAPARRGHHRPDTRARRSGGRDRRSGRLGTARGTGLSDRPMAPHPPWRRSRRSGRPGRPRL